MKEKQFNYTLFLPIFVLLLLSVYSHFVLIQFENVGQTFPLKQIFFCLLSLLVMYLVQYIPTHFFYRNASFFYFLSIVLMILLLFFYDPTMYTLTGTKRWIIIAGIKFQPAEIAKLTYGLFIVQKALCYGKDGIKSDLCFMLKLFLYSCPLFLLMIFQRDLGTTLVFVIMLIIILIISGIDKKILGLIVFLVTICALAIVFLATTDNGIHLLQKMNIQSYQLDRIKAWLDPFAYKDSISFQQVQSLHAIARGGIMGTINSDYVYVPVRESDMIFTVIAERHGFLGASIILLTFFYFFLQAIHHSLMTNNKANLYLTVVLIFHLAFQVFENIGASIGLLPLSGIPLPFLSEGGTSLLITSVEVGILLGFKEL